MKIGRTANPSQSVFCSAQLCLLPRDCNRVSWEFLEQCLMRRSPFQEGTRNQSEPAEPNRTEPLHSGTALFRNRMRKRTEANRKEPRRVRQKKTSRTASNRDNLSFEPNRIVFNNYGTDTNRTEPVPSCYLLSLPTATRTSLFSYRLP